MKDTPASRAIMTLTGLSKSFGGLKAVQTVSIVVPQGSLTALICRARLCAEEWCH